MSLAEKSICVDCGRKTHDIPRIDYTVEENRENGWAHPEGGYMCYNCEDNHYIEAHLEGEEYCPEHGFRESYWNMKDENGEYIGCYEGCEAAAEFDKAARSSSIN